MKRRASTPDTSAHPSRRRRLDDQDRPPPPAGDDQAGGSAAVEELPVVPPGSPPFVSPPTAPEGRVVEVLGADSLVQSTSDEDPAPSGVEVEVDSDSGDEHYETVSEWDGDSSESAEDIFGPLPIEIFDLAVRPINGERMEGNLVYIPVVSTSESSEDEDPFRRARRE